MSKEDLLFYICFGGIPTDKEWAKEASKNKAQKVISVFGEDFHLIYWEKFDCSLKYKRDLREGGIQYDDNFQLPFCEKIAIKNDITFEQLNYFSVLNEVKNEQLH